MKTKLLLSLLLAFPGLLFAQNNYLTFQDTELPFQSNFVLKTNLIADAFTAVNLNFEAKIGPTSSIGVLAGYKLKREIDLSGFVVDSEGDKYNYEGKITPSGIFATPYYRYYPAGALTGFYVETFLRYYNYEYTVPYDYTNNEGKRYQGDLLGTADGFGGGIAIGGQIPLGQRIYLDIYGGVGVAQGNAHIETSDSDNLTAEDYAEIKKELDENKASTVNIFILGNTLSKATADATSSKAWADIESELFPILRGGICIGFAF